MGYFAVWKFCNRYLLYVAFLSATPRFWNTIFSEFKRVFSEKREQQHLTDAHQVELLRQEVPFILFYTYLFSQHIPPY